MVKRKQTDAPSSLNPFNESIVKIVSASVTYNRGARCVLTRVFETVDGERHTSNVTLDAENAYNAIEQIHRTLGHAEPFYQSGEKT